MSASGEARQLVSGMIARVARMQERAEAVEANLVRHAEAGSKHPLLALTLADCHAAVEDCKLLLGRLATANGLPN